MRIAMHLSKEDTDMKRFEDIDAWQEARRLASEVYRTTNDGPFKRDFGLKDQIRRSAVSVMANIAEGFGRKTNKDFAKFLYTSKSSAMETISHLYVSMDQNYTTKDLFSSLEKGYEKVIKMLVNLIKYLESNPRPQY